MKLGFVIPRNGKWIAIFNFRLSQDLVFFKVFTHVAHISNVLNQADISATKLQGALDEIA